MSKLLTELVNDFSKRELKQPFAQVLRKAQEIGLFQPALRESGISDLCLVLRELSGVDCGLAVALLAHATAREIIGQSASKGQAEAVLAFAPFQAAALSETLLFAEIRGGKTVLSGKAQAVVLAEQASHAVLAARTDKGCSYFLVPLTGQAVRLSSKISTLGMRACPLIDLTLTDAPAEMMGKAERATDLMMLGAAAIAQGLAQGSLNEALRYSKERRQGGKEIFEWSEVKMMLGAMASRVQAGALALARAQAAADSGEAGWERDAHAVAIVLQEQACALTSDGIQVLGGAGYTTEFTQEQRFRDAFHTQHLMGSLPGRKLRLAERL